VGEGLAALPHRYLVPAHAIVPRRAAILERVERVPHRELRRLLPGAPVHRRQSPAGTVPSPGNRDGIIVNPVGLTFTSVPIMDALEMFGGPIFELHFTNIHRRESVYHGSLVSKVATGVIAGLGATGYRVAVEAMLRRLGAVSDRKKRTSTTQARTAPRRRTATR